MKNNINMGSLLKILVIFLVLMLVFTFPLTSIETKDNKTLENDVNSFFQ